MDFLPPGTTWTMQLSGLENKLLSKSSTTRWSKGLNRPNQQRRREDEFCSQKDCWTEINLANKKREGLCRDMYLFTLSFSFDLPTNCRIKNRWAFSDISITDEWEFNSGRILGQTLQVDCALPSVSYSPHEKSNTGQSTVCDVLWPLSMLKWRRRRKRLGMGTVGQPVSQLGKTVGGNRASMHRGKEVESWKLGGKSENWPRRRYWGLDRGAQSGKTFEENRACNKKSPKTMTLMMVIATTMTMMMVMATLMTMMIVMATLMTMMIVMATLMTMMIVMARDTKMCLEGAFSWQSQSPLIPRSRALHVNAHNGCNTTLMHWI